MISFKRQPFFPLLIPLLSGIYSGNFLKTGFKLLLIGIIILVILFIAYNVCIKVFRGNYSLRWYSGLIIFIFLFIAGSFLALLKTPGRVETRENVISEGIIKGAEPWSTNGIKLIFKPYKVNSDRVYSPGDKWLLLFREAPEEGYYKGDKVILRGELSPLPKNTNPFVFDYGTYLRRNGFSGQMFSNPEDLILVQRHGSTSLFYIPEVIKTQSLSVLSRHGISEPALNIIKALLLGDRTDLDDDITQQFIKSGVIHVLAVSGLHVGIIYLMLNFILSLFFSSRSPWRFMLLTSGLIFYALVAGFSPSVSRAVLMFTILQAGNFIQREADNFNLLCASAFILLLINPMLLYHAGFWLSHLAVAGIFAFYNFFNNIFYFRFALWRWLWSLLSVSISAQIVALPYLLYNFKAFPIYFLLANILIVPLLAPVLLSAFLILIVNFIPFIPYAVAGFLDSTLLFIIEITDYIGSLPGAYLTNINMSFFLVPVMFIIIIIIYRLIANRSSIHWLMLAGSVVVLMLTISYQHFIKYNTKGVVVYEMGRYWMVDVFNSGAVVNFKHPGLSEKSMSYARNDIIRKFAVSDYASAIEKRNNQNDKGRIIKINLPHKDCIILSGPLTPDYRLSKKYNVDILIITSNYYGKPDNFLDSINCNKIILTGNIPQWKEKELYEYYATKELLIYNTGRDGAYVDLNRWVKK